MISGTLLRSCARVNSSAAGNTSRTDDSHRSRMRVERLRSATASSGNGWLRKMSNGGFAERDEVVMRSLTSEHPNVLMPCVAHRQPGSDFPGSIAARVAHVNEFA